MSLPSKERIYGNCSVQHPEGHIMFRCDERRANWYLNRSLADVIQENPLVIRLNFVPKGRGHIDEPYYLTQKENRCVACGSTKELTRHHAVPHCYRRWFPEELKSRSSHDVVPLCVPCHERYEPIAWELKKKLASDYEVPLEGNRNVDEDGVSVARKSAHALLAFGSKIPMDRKRFLLDRIAEYYGKDWQEVTYNELLLLDQLRKDHQQLTQTYGKLLVDKLTNYEDFIRLWRQHFVETMNPQFLAAHWDINHRLSNG